MQDIKKAADEIKKGNLVIFPTETVYGIGANALDINAIKKIFIAKKRPESNPLIVHVSSVEDFYKYALINQHQVLQIEKLSLFFPGPLTIILPKKEIIPDLVTANSSSVALRIPKHPIALELIKLSGVPICAPSANTYTKLSPTKVEHLTADIKLSASSIIDDGACSIGVESTVLSLLEDQPRLLRPGAITLEMLREVLGEVIFDNNHDKNISPGLAKMHYQPNTKLRFFKNENLIDEKTAVISFGKIKNNNYKYYYLLDENLISSGLYNLLHEIDKLDLDLILIEECEKTGIGLAIYDRLVKAQGKL